MQPTKPYTGNPISGSHHSHIQTPQYHSGNPVIYTGTPVSFSQRNHIQAHTDNSAIYRQSYLMQETQPPTMQLYAGSSEGIHFNYVLPNLKLIQSICIFYIKGKGCICQIDMAENTQNIYIKKHMISIIILFPFFLEKLMTK